MTSRAVFTHKSWTILHNLVVADFRQPNKIHPCFMRKITSVILRDGKKAQVRCDIVLITNLKDPDSDMPLQLANNRGCTDAKMAQMFFG
jgi:hypothetical protein